MSKKNFCFVYALPVFVLGLGVFVSYSFITYAQSQTIPNPSPEEMAAQGVTFPVPELGNCASRDECRSYCNVPQNMPACIAFAKAHGLMNDEEASRAEEFVKVLAAGGGPGGCRTPTECEAFCSDIKNIDTCVQFAEAHGVNDEHLQEGKKIRDYLKAGGQMPGGCTSKESCEAYCGDFNHADECFAFAEKAGVGPGAPPGQFGREGGGPRPEEIRKFIELAKKGETPGGCKSKEQCEAYCENSSHFEECITFAGKAGFLTPEQAATARKMGGKGPGGCNSEESCNAYCNDPTHREECFNFAEEHGLLPPEALEQMKKGMVRLRQGLEQAPPEVVACLKTALGPNIIDDIQSGKLVPGPQIGDRVRDCFQKFGTRFDPKEVFLHAPPQVLSCLKDKLGKDFDTVASGEMMPTPEMGDAMRVCFEQFQVQGGGGMGQGGPAPHFADFLRTAPPEIASCLREKLGDDFAKLQSGELQPGPDLKDKVESCFQSFRSPEAGGEGLPKGSTPLPQKIIGCLKGIYGDDLIEKILKGEAQPPADIGGKIQGCSVKTSNLPPAVVECVRGAYGSDFFEKMNSGQISPSEMQAKIQSCLTKVQSGNTPPAGAPGAVPPGIAPSGTLPSGTLPPSLNFPGPVSDCLKSSLTSGQFQSLQAGTPPSADVMQILNKCFTQSGVPPQSPPPSGTASTSLGSSLLNTLTPLIQFLAR